MPAKILAFLLLLFGVGASLSVLYKSLIAVVNPQFQKKPEQQSKRNQLNYSANNLKLDNRTEGNQELENILESGKPGNER
ncbi:hypothetical protein [Phosphitispora fastidiosa]|uniref:hypothetical protein n=1 Tax=Phosphitispora fastidiosa TaxID=2837202 RepID=UPI001E5B690F|nr:hypothetical protein [Phosphitispora fastidiosa]MBU7005436.1 hypothetical protein [Phosphitispora fastidiosa]